MKKHFLVLILFLVSFLGSSQENTRFSGFGVLPQHVPDYLYEALKMANTTEKRLVALDTIASIYYRTDNADSLTYYGQEMRQTLQNSKQPTSYDLLAFYYAGTGKQRQGLLDASIAQFLDGLSYPHPDTITRQSLAIGIAQTYLLKDEKEKTRLILDTLSAQVKKPELQSQLEILEGDYAYGNSAFAKAKKHYQKAIALLEGSPLIKQELNAEIRLAKVLLEQGQIEDALQRFITIKRKALDDNQYELYIKSIHYEGQIYTSRKNYSVAEIALNTAYVNAMQWDRMELQQQVLEDLTRLYRAKGDYQNAYNLMTQYIALTHRISTAQNAKTVRDLEIRYETLEKEKQISSLEAGQLVKDAEIKRQKTIKKAFLIGFFIILIPVISFLVVYYQKLQTQSKLTAQQEQLNKQEMQSLLQQQELELARTSITVQNEERHRIARELHDSIGGNLSAIKLLMNQDENTADDLVLKQIDQTYDQVREISHALMPKDFDSQLFTDLVRQYVQNFGKGRAFEVVYDCFRESEINNLPKTIHVAIFNSIKELLTNAHKHAQAGQIDIQLNYLEDPETYSSLHLLYEDDGVGFDLPTTQKGLGLKNLKDRVSEYKGTLTIDTAPERGTVININIPIQDSDEY